MLNAPQRRSFPRAIAALDPNDPSTIIALVPIIRPTSSLIRTSHLCRYAGQPFGDNRYFYRACCIDGAHNRSVLSLSGPPIWLPNVVPPKPPTFTKVLAGSSGIRRWPAETENHFTVGL